jgi:hypothetical protein
VRGSGTSGAASFTGSDAPSGIGTGTRTGAPRRLHGREPDRRYRNHERTGQRNELQQPRGDAEHDAVRHADPDESGRADDRHDQAREQLRADVCRKGSIDVPEKDVTPPAQLPAREEPERGLPKLIAILQKEEREDGDENQPGQVHEPAPHPGEQILLHVMGNAVRRLNHESVHCDPKIAWKRTRLALQPVLPTGLQTHYVSGELSAEFCQLSVQHG